MWHLRTRYSGALGRPGLTAELDSLKHLFQTKQFYEAISLKYFLKPKTKKLLHLIFWVFCLCPWNINCILRKRENWVIQLLLWFRPTVLQNFHLPNMMETKQSSLLIFLGPNIGIEKSPRSKKSSPRDVYKKWKI